MQLMQCNECPAFETVCAGGIQWNGMCKDFHKALAKHNLCTITNQKLLCRKAVIMKIESVRKGKCSECDSKATKVVDEGLYCSKCCDTLLIGIIGKCMKHIKYADVKMSILPKRGKTIKGV